MRSVIGRQSSLAIVGRRTPLLTLSPMSGLWRGCAEKTLFGRPGGSLLDGIEYSAGIEYLAKIVRSFLTTMFRGAIRDFV